MRNYRKFVTGKCRCHDPDDELLSDSKIAIIFGLDDFFLKKNLERLVYK